MKAVILGNVASGKSYFAKEMSRKLKVSLFSLDKIYWKANWKHVSRAEFLQRQQVLLKEKDWIIEGTFSEFGLAERFRASDHVILLDIFSPLQALRRAIRRRGDERESLPDGADDRKIGFVLSLAFMCEILTFNLRERRYILRLAKEFPGKLVIIKTWADETEIIERLGKK